jgi:surface-anchored protein
VNPSPDQLFLGVGGYLLPNNTFSGPLTNYLTRLEGPGDFFVWQSDLGTRTFLIDTSDGIDASDHLPVIPGSHDHFNWGFSSSGVYCVTFRVEGILAADSSLVVGLEHTWVFHVQPLGIVTPFDMWQKVHWLQGTDPTISGPGADPEGDSLVNAIEYGSNLDPNTVTTEGRPEFSYAEASGESYGAWTFTRIKGIPDLMYLPRATSDLSDNEWTDMKISVELEDQGATERITLRDASAVSETGRRFYQYAVELTP